MRSVAELKIKLFADGADKAQILQAQANPMIRGFTTNPTLMRAAGVKDYEAFAHEVLKVVTDRPISFEVFADEFCEMERQAHKIAPDKKQKILNRMETYDHLSPEKQLQAQTLFQQYEGLPSDQRSQVSQAYRKLRQMSPDQRTQYFNSDEFRSSFNDQQRDLLRGMAELYPSQVR